MAIAAVLASPPAWPCAPAPPRGVTVSILDETALIVWDEARKTEHFIRGASFRSEARDFGFLVPTPSVPELAEAEEALFHRLSDAIQPPVVHEPRLAGVAPTAVVCFPFLMLRTGGSDGAPGRAPVRVLLEQQVSGYDAVVLEADDAGALSAWLAEHGYDDRPELAAWLAPYVAAAHKITAFKVSGSVGPGFATSPVRMSFRTDRPFFPYREPEDQREDATPRKLFVYFVGTGRVDGAVGSAGGQAGAAAWPAKVLWSDRIADAALLEGALPAGMTLPAGSWLTAFEDRSAPRAGSEDLFFVPAARAEAYRPPPVVVVDRWYLPLPLDVVAGAAVAVVLVLRRRARRRGR